MTAIGTATTIITTIITTTTTIVVAEGIAAISSHSAADAITVGGKLIQRI
ncbi:hypothetical protein [Peribacillus frigoritolerans]